MFAIVENDVVTQYVTPGNGFSCGGNSYPNDWVYLSTPEEKKAIGLIEVVEGTFPDQNFYNVSKLQPVYNKEKNIVEANYTWTEKPLQEIKLTQTSKINSSVYMFLNSSDWRVVKQMETGIPMPKVWSDYRNGIREQGEQAKIALNNATNISEVMEAINVRWLTRPE